MIQYANDVKTARAQAVADAIDNGTGQALLTLYTGPAPVAGDPIDTQTAIMALPIPNPCSQQVAGGILTLQPLPETMAVASGSMVWGRITSRAGEFVGDLTVGLPGSGADLILPVVDIYAGAMIRINSASISEV